MSTTKDASNCNWKILIVEDEAFNRIYLKNIIEKEEWCALEAVNGKQAVEMTEEYDPDLILMDVGLPVLNGIEASKKIRERLQYRETPIIGLTAHSQCDDIALFLSIGMNMVISKPFRWEQVITSIQECMEKARPGARKQAPC